MNQPLRVLIWGDPTSGPEALTVAARRQGFDVTVERADSATENGDWDLILASDEAPWPAQHRGTPVVLVTGSRDEETMAAAIRAGAMVVSGDCDVMVEATLERALHEAQGRRARLRAEQALAKVEERYQDLVEIANDVVLTIDLQGNFTALNAAGEQISGYTRAEVQQMNMREVLTPESYRHALQMIEEKLRNPHATTYELDLLTRDGSIVPLEVSSKIIFHDGRPVGVHAIARDIRERRQAEEELRARERKQAAVAALGQTAIASTDLSDLFQQAVECVAETLNVELCSVLELVGEGAVLEARAGVGWHEGVIERGWVGAGPQSQAGFTLLASEPVVVDDLRVESRFSVPKVLKDHVATSGISVIIHGHHSPFGVLSAFTREQRCFTQDDVHFLQAVAHVLGASVDRRRLEEERAQHDKELAARVLQAQEEERKRIARELHDETAQTLSVLLTNVDLLQQNLPPDESWIAAGFERIGTLAKRALDETRALSHDLRPTILDDAGLVAALEWIAAEYERSYGGSVQVRATIGDIACLSPQAEVALFRIAQEALTNSGKHAHAGRVTVSLDVGESMAELVVKDNGEGFDPGAVQAPSREGGLGLYGMAERAALFGGTLSIKSKPQQGTELRVRMPVEVQPAPPLAMARMEMP